MAQIPGYDKDPSEIDSNPIAKLQRGNPEGGSSPGRFLQMRRQRGGSRPGSAAVPWRQLGNSGALKPRDSTRRSPQASGIPSGATLSAAECNGDYVR